MAGCHYGHFFQANAFSFFGELLFHGWGRGPEVLWMVPRSHSHTWGVQDPKPRTSRGLQDGSKPGKPPGLGEGVGPGQEVRMQGPAGRPPAPCLLSGHGDHTGTQGHTWTVSVGREQTKSSDCISNGHRRGSDGVALNFLVEEEKQRQQLLLVTKRKYVTFSGKFFSWQQFVEESM